ncbi:hypothetical protein EDD29_4286 [Actinocorallia herbida]|uniref:Uncharacterized protein n=1 Tax=Actinocorallia herbida TaxID=58109 RepID=A0A3N1D0X2_9ACTN|nr:hypothetical protein [Actinocorallia herbida]ROO86708.1 hypothetical protein EDD29_4286 [Actinocorallia herbida]
MGMDGAVEGVIDEALRDLAAGHWRMSRTERARAEELRVTLGSFGRPSAEVAGVRERLEDLREGLAAAAICVASCHGPLAWCLSQVILALNPILSWRSLPEVAGHDYGTVIPTPDQLTDAEQAMARLHHFLTDSAHWR